MSKVRIGPTLDQTKGQISANIQNSVPIVAAANVDVLPIARARVRIRTACVPQALDLCARDSDRRRGAAELADGAGVVTRVDVGLDDIAVIVEDAIVLVPEVGDAIVEARADGVHANDSGDKGSGDSRLEHRACKRLWVRWN